jgi:hypothetical protein
MPCNCTNQYCFDKVPEESIVRSNGEPAYVYLKNVKYNRMTQIMSWDEWVILCDNCRTDNVGCAWEPFVPRKK